MGGRNGAGASPCASCSANEERSELVRRVNAHIRSVLPQLTYTALAVVHGVGDHPMLVHTHPKDDSPLTGEIALGDFVGGELFTSALLCANGPSRPAWICWGRDLLWGHIVDPRYGVMFNALRPHVPRAWSGQRIVPVHRHCMGTSACGDAERTGHVWPPKVKMFFLCSASCNSG